MSTHFHSWKLQWHPKYGRHFPETKKDASPVRISVIKNNNHIYKVCLQQLLFTASFRSVEQKMSYLAIYQIEKQAKKRSPRLVSPSQQPRGKSSEEDFKNTTAHLCWSQHSTVLAELHWHTGLSPPLTHNTADYPLAWTGLGLRGRFMAQDSGISGQELLGN